MDDNNSNQFSTPPQPTPTSLKNPPQPHQTPTPQPQPPTPNSSTNPTADINRKISFWKKLSIILGLISLFGYIIIFITSNVLAREQQYSWVIFMMFGLVATRLLSILLILSITALVRVIILSSKRKKHLFKDYVTVVIGLALVFSPFAVSGILSYFRISWNENGGIFINLKSKDPYYITSSTSGGYSCADSQETSNDLKNVDINERYNYVKGDKEQREFATKQYLVLISQEILCQVGKFYEQNGRYPNENEIANFSTKAISEDIRNGVYNIKLETGNEPNEEDFTILFDRNCTNKKDDTGNVAILSPRYDTYGRYCTYRDIGSLIVKDTTSSETTRPPSNSPSTPSNSSPITPNKLDYNHTVAHRCWGAAGEGEVFAAEDLTDYAMDIACAYLSYQAYEKATPTTQADIMKYLPADYAELLPNHATPTITFNADNPSKPYIFNICTSAKCNADFDGKRIAVFYVNPLRPNQLYRSEIESYDTSLYDLENTDSWYNTIFDNYPRESTNRFYSNTN